MVPVKPRPSPEHTSQVNGTNVHQSKALSVLCGHYRSLQELVQVRFVKRQGTVMPLRFSRQAVEKLLEHPWIAGDHFLELFKEPVKSLPDLMRHFLQRFCPWFQFSDQPKLICCVLEGINIAEWK